MKKFIPVVVVLVIALGIVGCEEERHRAELSTSMNDMIGTQLKTSWQAATGETLSSTATTIERSRLSESHAIMASMILMGRGMESDLSTYKDLYLVEFTDAGGVERAAVYANGEVILPAGAGQ